ncbi:prepilin-type N-terminal cleavage/methylation domain-containing protein [Sporosarcina jeotgali]|uniref:Prepilin-type N-terminal cleavage/methylation domain-containing protein n=1 Tax=Sporosarcina jeotgali TaxID=3020056 RepID=A0ABZ0KUG4_9BACL|nr:prepilin-type N-terminal cleavage/methylation domain-containing protein [Sporosarcina sp. B2O-1]WOV82947.1 prepilin-type N-terminal cleavage/methylation domain-containing protein [Sporosarcina sp. B2O-1]
MNKHMNSRGVSLVEVLAALVLLSMIFLLIISTQLFGEREYNTQNEQFSNEVSLQFVIKDITREIRRIDDNNKIKIDPQKSELIIGKNVYILSNMGLMKNSSILADNIQDFKLEFNNSRDTLNISIITNGSDRSEKEIVTSIFLREGDSR